MKHVKDIIGKTQLGLFAVKPEKGSREWKAFDAIRHDHVGMFRVASPRKHEVPRYPNILHIARYPRHLTLRVAR